MSISERAAPTSPLIIFRDRLTARRDELAHALEGSGISPERFIRTATTAMQVNPDLADVTFQSLWVALLKACRDQLLPDGVHGAIVPYKKQATWVPMYRGLVSRFERSGHYRWIAADFHRADDLSWDLWIDEKGQHFLHRPGNRAGAILETYACATTEAGAFFISVVSTADMQRIRAMSRTTREDAPWERWSDEMMKKTALRRLCKILPMPAPIEELVNRDAGAATGHPEEPPPMPLPRPRGTAAVLEQFARGPAEEAVHPESENPAPAEISANEQPPVSATAAVEKPAEPAQPAVEPPQVYLATAHQRGRDARREGQPAKAMPEEYKDPTRAREAIAWQRGFNGEPI